MCAGCFVFPNETLLVLTTHLSHTLHHHTTKQNKTTTYSADPDRNEGKAFLDLPKPAHLVFVKPTVAVVAGLAERSSVGVKMTIGENQLERYVVEYYSRRL